MKKGKNEFLENISFDVNYKNDMRIGFILDTDFPPDSRVENEAISLIEAGHEVFLFSLSYKSFEKDSESLNGIHVRRYKASKLIYKLSALAHPFPFYQVLVKPKIVDFIRKNSIEVLHVHDMVIAPAALEANKIFQLNFILDLHENRPVIMKYYPHLQRWPGKFLIKPGAWERAQRLLVEQANKVILVTEEAKDDYVQRYKLDPEKIVVVPNTVHPDVFSRYPLNKELISRFKGSFNLLYVGDTGLRRGTDIAIQAVALLLPEIPEIKLILVGKSSEDVILRKLVADLQLERQVTFEGWQNVKLFPSYIQAADVCLSPLSRNLHHDTTYANKIFQYMAMGKALVVSDSTAQANVVKKEKCGVVYKAGDIGQMKDAILQLYQQPEIREAMGKAAANAVKERWNWKVTSRSLIEAYKEIAV